MHAAASDPIPQVLTFTWPMMIWGPGLYAAYYEDTRNILAKRSSSIGWARLQHRPPEIDAFPLSKHALHRGAPGRHPTPKRRIIHPFFPSPAPSLDAQRLS
ncbi:hypothetical protein CH63R_04843 [Colletotrichum higginsianum IMI 349063]|uniref:Uncharacterized protein n=1 Tax=Colletotrichum higginsianum (strain IMI 349063) TaxID=759273 RepID=A0A1B7YKF5_COLHI|nr:hypothetical protein CH63R_04843 [Colletotrichum higginsianum IMI 349063]OBR12547.1 hypothetical protein CH63R_04843 [Colletotrichum higginsianum IMI 349063]